MVKIIIIISIFSGLFGFFQEVYAYQLTLVKAVSETQKSFITNMGKKDGISLGTEATFTTKDISFVAIAKKVTREYTQWQLTNPNATMPFKKDEVITFNWATEHVWALVPDSITQKMKKKKIMEYPRALLFRTSYLYGLGQSTSGVSSTGGERGGMQVDILYEYYLNNTLSLGGGIRYEQDATVSGLSTVSTTKYMFLGEFTFYFPEIVKFYNSQIYIGGTVGYGATNSSWEGYSQNGNVRLLPGLRLGIDLPLASNFSFNIEGGTESQSIVEILPDGSNQTTDQTSAKFTIALKMFL